MPAYSDTLGEQQKCHCKRGLTVTTYGLSGLSDDPGCSQGHEGVDLPLEHGSEQERERDQSVIHDSG